VRSQVRVGAFSAIDLVVEDQIALELDGRAFHEATFEADRRKDLAITIEGRHSIRISRRILRESWTDVERAIAAGLAARRHGDAGKSGELFAPPKRKLRARAGGGQLS
jgi:very-short-patch-repair endonuclease